MCPTRRKKRAQLVAYDAGGPSAWAREGEGKKQIITDDGRSERASELPKASSDPSIPNADQGTSFRLWTPVMVGDFQKKLNADVTILEKRNKIYLRKPPPPPPPRPPPPRPPEKPLPPPPRPPPPKPPPLPRPPPPRPPPPRPPPKLPPRLLNQTLVRCLKSPNKTKHTEQNKNNE